MEDKCNLCTNLQESNYIVYVHKYREYGGYSKGEYPRYFCSQECLVKYEKNGKCNFCGMVCYDWRETKKGDDGYTYCNDDDISVGDTTCYNQAFNQPFNK